MSQSTHTITDTVREFNDYLKGYIMKKVSDPLLAEDLTQEVMYRLVEADEENREIHNVKAWLFQTTRNVIADHYRDKSRSPLVNLSESTINTSNQSMTDLETFTDLNDEFASISDVDFILPILKLLPEKYGKPLIMSDIKNIPQKEIAKQMGIGLSATKMRIKRARQKLYDLFVECCEIEYDSRGDFAGCTIKEYCTPFLKIRNELCKKDDYEM